MKNPEEDLRYKSLHEDVLEALCGSIKEIMDFHTKPFRGMGYDACYNLVSSYLYEWKNEFNPTVDYETLWDHVSRLKELYDTLKWNDVKPSAPFQRSTEVVQIYDMSDPAKRTRALTLYNNYVPVNKDQNILEATAGHLAIAVVRIPPNLQEKIFITAVLKNAQKDAKQAASFAVLQYLEPKYGHYIVPPSPYVQQQPKKPKPKPTSYVQQQPTNPVQQPKKSNPYVQQYPKKLNPYARQ